VENKVILYKKRKLFNLLAKGNEAIDAALLWGISYSWYKGKLISFE
jgi:hypothetical protein